MNPSSIALVIVAACGLAGAACHKSPSASAPRQDDVRPVDEELRTFLGIRTVRGRFALPETAAGYYPVAILFADGREVARKKCPMYLSQGAASVARRVDIQLLCQYEQGAFRRAALVDQGNATELGDGYPWDDFASAGWRSMNAEEAIQYQGITILGIMASRGKAGGDHGVALYTSAENLPASNKYVIAIGIDTDTDPGKLRERFLPGKAK